MRTWLLGGLRLLRALAALAIGCLVLVSGLWVLVQSPSASAWLMRQLPGVSVVGPQGAVWGDFRADRIDVDLPRGGHLAVLAPRWSRLRLVWDPDAATWLGVRADALSAQRITLRWVGDPHSPPAQAPDHLRLPVSVAIPVVTVEEAHSALWGRPLMGLRLSVQSQHDVHLLQVQAAQWAGWRVGPQGMNLRLGGQAPMPVSLSADWVSAAEAKAGSGQPGAVRLQVQGPLADLRAQGTARWLPATPRAPSLDLTARVQPFAAWPVAEAAVQTQALDLSALHPDAPHTALSGRVSLLPDGAQGLALTLDVRNELPGAWDTQRLPLQRVQGQVTVPEGRLITQGRPWQQAFQQARADVNIALPALPGGPQAQATLTGGWREGVPLRLRLSGVQPQALHRAAPPWLLQGDILAQAVGSTLGAAKQVGLTAQLQGRFGRAHAAKAAAHAGPAATQAIALDLDADWTEAAWSVRSLRLRSAPAGGGAASAVLAIAPSAAEALLSDARLVWRSATDWQATGQVAVRQFDPQVWLPWPQALAGRNSLSVQGRFDVDAQARGKADVVVQSSTLAGLPLAGDLRWRGGAAGGDQLQGAFDVAGNRLQVQSDGGHGWALDGRWQLHLSAPQLQSLAAVAPALGLRQLQGSVQLDARWQGAGWPVSSEGAVNARDLRFTRADGGVTSLASAVGDWRWDTDGRTSPPGIPGWHARLQIEQGRGSGWQVQTGVLQLDGTPAQHQLRVSARGQAERAVAQGSSQSETDTAVPMALDVQLDGRWQPVRTASQGAVARWQGRLSQAQLSSPGTSMPVWAQIEPTDILWEATPTGPRLAVEPTRMRVVGAELSLERMRWQGGAPAEGAEGRTQALDLLVRVAPLNLAQWLSSWQPQAGWGGDLMVAGQWRMQRQPGQAWVVDAELSRQSGDITLSEPTVEGQVAQKLGLREARVSLTARDGQWTLQQAFDGRVLGRLSGRQSLQARDPRAWPSADSPLSGNLDLHIASLRALATWAPAAWRIDGQLQGQAQIAGTAGQPRWTGWVQGERLAASQSLLGVQLSDGLLRLELDGSQARLTRFEASGGPQGGRVVAEGLATWRTGLELTLRVQADRFAALQRVDRRIVLSGDTQALLNAETLRLRGRVTLDEGLIDIGRSDAPTLGDDVTVRRRPGVPDAADGGDASAGVGSSGRGRLSAVGQRKVDADVALDLGQKLRLKGLGLDGFLVGQLRLSTPANKPAIQGVVKLAQGTFAAYGQKLRIDRSTITFTGLIDNPRLDILAMRPQSPSAEDSDVRVGVRITGTALDPRIRLYSEPALSETEQLSWLVLGRAPTGLGGADIGLLQSAAVALLSGDSREGPTDQLIGLLGLDNLSVRQGEGTVRSTVVNVGKQVSRHWYVGYERNLNATGGNWQLIYSLAQRFKLRAQAGADNAMDLIFQWRWD